MSVIRLAAYTLGTGVFVAVGGTAVGDAVGGTAVALGGTGVGRGGAGVTVAGGGAAVAVGGTAVGSSRGAAAGGGAEIASGGAIGGVGSACRGIAGPFNVSACGTAQAPKAPSAVPLTSQRNRRRPTCRARAEPVPIFVFLHRQAKRSEE